MGSPFASLAKSDPIPLPFDPGHSIVVRALTGPEFEDVQRTHALGVLIGRARVWNENIRQILEKGLVQASELANALKDPLTGFDRLAMVRAGLVSWTYPQSIKPTPATPAEGKQAAVEAYDPIADLQDEPLEFVALEILKRTKPSLFLTEDEQETERKNG
jgi:hypothetical protein